LILVDTNILLRRSVVTDPLFVAVKASIDSLHAGGETLCIVPQNVYEFWATATRPKAANGLGLSIAECQAQVVWLKSNFQLLSDLPTLFDEWEQLVVAHQCHGRVSYDARLVAAMRTHGITQFLTLNTADFARFPGLTLIDPTAGPTTVPPTGP
jgi:predicted nucleic acid-binding protein